MAAISLVDLKARFQPGDRPSGKDFIDLIDSLSQSVTSVANGSIGPLQLADDAVNEDKLAALSVVAGSFKVAAASKTWQTDGTGATVLDDPVATATSVADRSITHAKLQKAATFYAVDSGTADALAVAYTPAIDAYADGMVLHVVKGNAPNAGPCTLNVNGLGAIAIVKNNDAALDAADLPANCAFAVIKKGAAFKLVNPLFVTLASGRVFATTTLTGGAALAATDTLIGSLSLGLPAGKTWRRIRVIFSTSLGVSAKITDIKVKLGADVGAIAWNNNIPSAIALATDAAQAMQVNYITEGIPTDHLTEDNLSVNLYAEKNDGTNGDVITNRAWYVVGEYY